MLRRYTLLKVNIREQLPRPYIRAPHSCLPQIAQTTNHIRNSLSGHFFSSLLILLAGRSGDTRRALANEFRKQGQAGRKENAIDKDDEVLNLNMIHIIK